MRSFQCWSYKDGAGYKAEAEYAIDAVRSKYDRPGTEVIWSHGSATYDQAIYVVTETTVGGKPVHQFSVTVRETNNDR